MDESNKNMIKVGFLVSYDYQLLEYSLPIVYQYADEIYLAIDKERKTWSGNIFQLPDTFFECINRVDTVGKDNYKEVKNFHPLYPPAWSELKYINANDIYSLINKMRDL